MTDAELIAQARTWFSLAGPNEKSLLHKLADALERANAKITRHEAYSPGSCCGHKHCRCIAARDAKIAELESPITNEGWMARDEETGILHGATYWRIRAMKAEARASSPAPTREQIARAICTVSKELATATHPYPIAMLAGFDDISESEREGYRAMADAVLALFAERAR